MVSLKLLSKVYTLEDQSKPNIDVKKKHSTVFLINEYDKSKISLNIDKLKDVNTRGWIFYDSETGSFLSGKNKKEIQDAYIKEKKILDCLNQEKYDYYDAKTPLLLSVLLFENPSFFEETDLEKLNLLFPKPLKKFYFELISLEPQFISWIKEKTNKATIFKNKHKYVFKTSDLSSYNSFKKELNELKNTHFREITAKNFNE